MTKLVFMCMTTLPNQNSVCVDTRNNSQGKQLLNFIFIGLVREVNMNIINEVQHVSSQSEKIK